MPDATNSTQKWVLFQYTPSIPAAVIFFILFGICGIFHIYRLFRFKGWYFVPFIIGVIFETIGYIGRVGCHFHTTSIGWFILQQLLILLAPALFAASIYMTLSRIAIALHAEHFLVIRARWLTAFFVLGDVLSFLAQSAGGGMMAQKTPEAQKNGQHIITGGLFIQIFFFCGFIVIATIFHKRLASSPSHVQQAMLGRKYMWTMYVANIFILIRSVFRVVEFIGPHDGPLMSHEVYLYIFDSTLMFIVVASYLVVKPYGDLFDEWKRRKDAGDLEMTRGNLSQDIGAVPPMGEAESSFSSLHSNSQKPAHY
ncbi:hypothetical protein AA313_de0208674 [Arthrobotrys entomopaga]|nr:hypothetical protein AA313_de0208674 [Arthrobotrys entomopaga]